MKFLLIGEHYSQNLGDGVISLSVRNLLKNKCNFDLLDLSQKRGYEVCQNSIKIAGNIIKKALLQISVINYVNEHLKARSKLKNYLDEFASDYDAAIYVGGSLFMDYFVVKQFYVNKWLKDKNITVLYNACGMGRLSNFFFERMLVKAVNMDNVSYISMRDSEKKFKHITKRSVISTYDNAVIISDYIKKRTRNNKVFGIGFISRDKSFNQQYYRSVKKLIYRLNEKKIVWEFFSNGDPNDTAFMQNCFSRLRKKNMTYIGTIATIPHTPEELINLVSGYERIVTCRLHSAIVAYSYLIPTCAVSWDNKVNSFYNKIGHEELVLSKNIDVSWIMEKFVDFSYDDSDKEKLASIKNEIRLNMDRIIELCK